jgi:hypothetical protein
MVASYRVTPPTVVFVCQHGAAKSVIAAAYLARLAAAAGMELQAIARGTEPDEQVSPVAASGLEAAGIPLPLQTPQRPTAGELGRAWRVVSFGPELDVPAERWDDVPAVADGFEAVRDSIVARLAALLATKPVE